VSDGHGGILIEDPVQNDSTPNANNGATPSVADNTNKGVQAPAQDASHAWSTASTDGFVFKADAGANSPFDAGHSPTWLDLGHSDTAGKAAQAMQSQDAAELPNLQALHDALTPDSLKTHLLSHHSEFHFV
jgi:hypothetical protein